MGTILFLDDWMLAKRNDLVRRLGAPRWLPEGTLEGPLCDATWNRPTVFRCEDGKGWRAIYSGVTYEGGKRVPLGMMVAESEDGVRWVKPDVSRIVHLPGRRLPNQVYMAISGGPAYFDERDPDPMRRLKFLYTDHTAPEGRRLLFLTSPDGIRWREAGVWGDRRLDAPVSIFYNSNRDSYVISNRPVLADRRVAFVETKDFRTFSIPQLALAPDPDDAPLLQFYGMTVFPYEGMYLGLVLLFHTDPAELFKRGGYVEGGLAYSYDGWHFNRAFHTAMISRSSREEQGGGSIYPSCMVVDESNCIRIYSGGSRATHFQTTEPVDAALMLHTLRLDGFAYLEPVSVRGCLTTRRLRFGGDRLQLNVKAPHGRVRVQIVDGTGRPFPGFGFDDCRGFTGDALFHTPTWSACCAPGSLADRDAHVEIELVHAELYAIRGDFVVYTGAPAVT